MPARGTESRPQRRYELRFLGPYAHGPKQERFIYLNWATTKAEELTSMIGRIKLHLNHIRWVAVQRAARDDKPIRVKLALTSAKGSPVMASLRPGAAQWELDVH